jgi:hypothetical protein
LEDIKNYVPKMTEGVPQKEFYAKMMAGHYVPKDEGKEDMIQHIKTPERPHFIFSGKMWEIEEEFTFSPGDEYRTKITFEHIIKTPAFDEDFDICPDDKGIRLPNGECWTIIETVIVKIDDEFSDPIITMFKKNTGTMVGKDDGHSKNIPAMDTLSLPLYDIEKLVRVASNLDTRNRQKMVRFSPKFTEILKVINEETAK